MKTFYLLHFLFLIALSGCYSGTVCKSNAEVNTNRHGSSNQKEGLSRIFPKLSSNRISIIEFEKLIRAGDQEGNGSRKFQYIGSDKKHHFYRSKKIGLAEEEMVKILKSEQQKYLEFPIRTELSCWQDKRKKNKYYVFEEEGQKLLEALRKGRFVK